jgi:hypothetical protein
VIVDVSSCAAQGGLRNPADASVSDEMPSPETWWAAVSRAVRTPSRVIQNLVNHPFVSPIRLTFVAIPGDPAPVAKALLAHELGCRAQPTDEFEWEIEGGTASTEVQAQVFTSLTWTY